MSKPWSLRDVKLPREDVVAAVDGAQGLPDEAKMFIKAMAAALPETATLVRVDAHSFASPSQVTITLTVARL
jgi:hypothetical protein